MAHERAGTPEGLNLKCSECGRTIKKAATVQLNYETISGETKRMTSRPLHVKCAEFLALKFAAFGHRPVAMLIA